jgi:formate/nitrite transporter FocA (FNT family)
MFYFSLAGDFSAPMLKSLVVITIGNSIGGGLIPLAWTFAPTRDKQE